jgi:magnesium transporter
LTQRPDPALLPETIARLLRRNANKNIARILDSAHAADIARLYRHIGPSRWKQLFELIKPAEKAAETLTEIDRELLEPFLERFTDHDLVGLLGLMSSDDAADVLECLPEERAEAIIGMARASEDLEDAAGLLRYDPETAGGLMVSEVFALPASTTAGEAIAELQRSGDDFEMVFYVYVLNDHGHLVGVCSLRELVTVPPSIQLADIMTTDVVRVHAGEDQEEVARIVARYNLLALPVVDEHNRLVGMVTVDDIIDVIRLEATEDMMKMAGVSNVSVAERQSVVSSAKARIPWLFASFLGGLAAMAVISSFTDTLARLAALASFIPIVLGMGGNVGTQSSTIVTRGLALGHIDLRRLWSIVGREIGVGLICGLCYGVFLGAIAAFVYRTDAAVASPLLLALTVGFSIACAMSIASLVGGSIPLLFQRLNIDPAIAAGPFVTTSVDVLGILAYFTIAQVLLSL